MVAVVELATTAVVMVKLALVAPAATVAPDGTTAAALSLDSPTVMPPPGAALLKVTVPVDVPPPTTVPGLNTTEVRLGEKGATVTVRIDDFVAPPPLAEMVTCLCAVADLVVTVKLAALFPDSTVTAAGTVAVEVRLLERVTANPAAGAGVLRRTVPVDGVPPWTLVGSRPTEATAIRAMDSPAVRFTPA